MDDLIETIAPGSRVERTWPLAGGVSSEVIAVAFVRTDGVGETVVVRRQRDHAWKPGEPGGIVREHALLVHLHAAGIPVPRPRLLRGDALVQDFVAGTSELPADAAERMADVLAQIHGVDIEGLPDVPAREDPVPALQGWLPAMTEAVAAREPSRGPARLLHGDFWPGNLLWRDGRIAAVLDWEDAAIGDPLSDLACARVELACAAGERVASAFTDAYLRRTGMEPDFLPVWDLYVSTAALSSMAEWGLAPDVLATRRAVTLAFQAAALRALG